jgi:hypothetical protein
MKLRITDVDYAPEELYGQVPFEASLLREVPGKDRPDYWLAELAKPLQWKSKEGNEVTVTHIVLTARYVGARIAPGVGEITVGIAYITDISALADAQLDFSKCYYSAIGTAREVR